MRTIDESAGIMLSAMADMGRQAQRPAQVFLGEVLAGTQEGLRVTCNGQELDRSDLWIAENLLEGYSPKLTGTLRGTCPDGECVTEVTKDQLTRSEFALKKGDRVVLVSNDLQIYYILCKVVSL